jgi:hypothetical protein
MRLMVLKDRETYSDVAGCSIIEVADDVMARLDAGDVRAGDFEDHGIRLFTFDGEEAGLASFTAEERQFAQALLVTPPLATIPVGVLRIQLQVLLERVHRVRYESIAEKTRRAALTELRVAPRAQSANAELQLTIFPLYPAGNTGDAIEEVTASTVPGLLLALERATERLRQGDLRGGR